MKKIDLKNSRTKSVQLVDVAFNRWRYREYRRIFFSLKKFGFF